MDQATPAPNQKLHRKWPRRIVFALLFFILAIGGSILFYYWVATSDWETVIAEADRMDPGWRWDELEAGRKMIPDANNSALHIMAMEKMHGNMNVVGRNPIFDALDLTPQIQLNGQQVTFLEKRFEVLGKALLDARKIKDMPEGRYPILKDRIESGFYPNFNNLRVIGDLLWWDAAWRVHFDDGDGALESCLAMQNVARSLGDEPMLRPYLWTRYCVDALSVIAIERTLAQGRFTEASEPTLRRLQAGLAKELGEPLFLIGLRGERAFQNWVGAPMMGVPPKRGPIPFTETFQDTIIEHFPGYLTTQQTALLRFYNDMVEAAKLAPEEREQRFLMIEKAAEGGPMLVRSAAESILKTRKDERHYRVFLLCGCSILAAERYRLTHKQWPESHDVLVKTKFLDSIPVDPYDGKPLRLKRMPDGLLIYSVGPDGKDNGGTIDPEQPYSPGSDMGLRLWDIDSRRQPPNLPVAVKD